jgi:hypothetical protein
MDDLLRVSYINYLNSLKPHVATCTNVEIKVIKSDVIDDVHFDLKDKEINIKQPLGTGSVTYNNPTNKIIAVIDYERFLNLQSDDLIKRLSLKKCDFIVYHLNGDSFFILNELSQSSSESNKRKDAIIQLWNAVKNFRKSSDINTFIDEFSTKQCVFSNRSNQIRTPNRIADAFGYIQTLLPIPNKMNFSQITDAGFELFSTSIIDV